MTAPTTEEQLLDLEERLKDLEAYRFQQDEEIRRLKAHQNALSQFVPVLAVDGIEIGRNFFRGEQGALQFASPDSNDHGVIYFFDPDDGLATDPANQYPRSYVGTGQNGGLPSLSLVAESSASSATNAEVRIIGNPSGGSIRMNVSDGSNGKAALLLFGTHIQSALPLLLYNPTSDPSSPADGWILYRSDTDKVRARINGSWENLATETYADAAGGGGMELVVQESDQTLNSQTTLQNSELTFSVAANEVWQFEGNLFWESGATPDIKWTVVGPSGAVGSFGMVSPTVNYLSQPLGTTITDAGVTVPRFTRFWGAIHNGANAGSATLQFAQDTSDPGDTTLFAGSYIKYQQES